MHYTCCNTKPQFVVQWDGQTNSGTSIANIFSYQWVPVAITTQLSLLSLRMELIIFHCILKNMAMLSKSMQELAHEKWSNPYEVYVLNWHKFMYKPFLFSQFKGGKLRSFFFKKHIMPYPDSLLSNNFLAINQSDCWT